MQSNEQRYPDQLQQDDFFDADLTDAHLKTQTQASNSSSDVSNNVTANHLAERFMRSLQHMEKTGEIESLVALFGEDADLLNLAMQRPLQGRPQIQHFWLNYLSVFDRIQSHFTHIAEGQLAGGKRTITLEWVSEGLLASGAPFNYRGVSILEVANDQVQHFRTYYDSALFVPETVKSLQDSL